MACFPLRFIYLNSKFRVLSCASRHEASSSLVRNSVTNCKAASKLTKHMEYEDNPPLGIGASRPHIQSPLQFLRPQWLLFVHVYHSVNTGLASSPYMSDLSYDTCLHRLPFFSMGTGTLFLAFFHRYPSTFTVFHSVNLSHLQ
jgi:hypothetical protein